MEYERGESYIKSAAHDPRRQVALVHKALEACPDDPRLGYDLACAWYNVLQANPEAIIKDVASRREAIAAVEAVLEPAEGGYASLGPPARYLAALQQFLAILYSLDGRMSDAEKPGATCSAD